MFLNPYGVCRTFGAVVLWNFWEKQLKTRVGLPSDVVPGFLYRLQPLAQHDLIICGCDNGHIAVVDMDLGESWWLLNGYLASNSKIPIVNTY